MFLPILNNLLKYAFFPSYAISLLIALFCVSALAIASALYFPALSSGIIHSPKPVLNKAYSAAAYPKVSIVASTLEAPARIASPYVSPTVIAVIYPLLSTEPNLV